MGLINSRADRLSLFAYLLAAVALLFRIRYGIDLYDESYYVATPLRFARGGTPFVDELHFSQTAALFGWLPVKGFLALGFTDGIVLFCRYLYVTFTLLVGVGLARALAPRLGGVQAWGMATAYTLFVPVMTPTLSYNSLGLGFLLLGLFASWRRREFMAGFYLSLSALAYPTLCLISVGVGLACWNSDRSKNRNFVFYAGMVPVVILLLWLLEGRVTRLFDVLAFVKDYDPDRRFDAAKALVPLRIVFSPWTRSVFTLFMGTGLYLLRRKPKAFSWAIALLPIAAFAVAHPRFGGGGQADFIVWLAIIPAIVASIVRLVDPEWNGLFRRVILPSWLAAVICSLSSHMGMSAVSVGIFPAFLVGLYWMGKHAAKTSLPYAFTVLFLLLFLRSGYGENAPNIFRLPVKMGAGPFKGLYSEATKVGFIRELQSDLDAALSPQLRTILSFPYLPAVYLMTSLQPAYPTQFAIQCGGANARFCANGSDVWVLCTEEKSDLLEKQKTSLIQKGYRLTSDKPLCSIIVK